MYSNMCARKEHIYFIRNLKRSFLFIQVVHYLSIIFHYILHWAIIKRFPGGMFR